MKNSTPGRPNVRSARLSEDLSRQIDAWIAAQPEPRPSRSEAIRFALHDWFSSQSAAVKPPALPPASDAFLRALGHQSENAEGPGVRLRKAAK
jgi:Arc/MetJ-type ribon-helix-helix transcriptional regulator